MQQVSQLKNWQGGGSYLGLGDEFQDVAYGPARINPQAPGLIACGMDAAFQLLIFLTLYNLLLNNML